MASGTEILRYNSHWSLDSGYKSKSDVNDYPIRMHNAGPSAAFSILLSTFTENLEYRCRGFDQGFKVVLSVPGEALKLSRNFLRVPTSADTFIKITPKLTTFSEGILKYTPAQRQCFHSDERRLRFYKIYTKSSCEVECLANFTNIECGCVKFSMPRDKHTKMCGGASVKCYRIAEKRLATTAQSFRDQCNCLPTCTSIEYKAEVDRINYDAKDAVESMAGDGRVPYK
ncbi:pickpocket protein 28-like [Sitodiplosis mosellana]|uniref:pickpocket protein 28-like n=1 Tax=Sitodiplosis mosellana TaxID=263140 RepID=UPI0024448BCD|nr:pickpocket protein 28-like [Sitodiplosis mosellana]